MPMIVDLTRYFTAQKIAKRFKAMPPLKTTFYDRHFPEAVRSQYEGPIIPLQEIYRTVQAVPVVRRGAESVPMEGEEFDNVYIEPLPVRIHTNISAKDLNDLRLVSEESRERWAARRQEAMRKTVRLVTEILAAQAVLNGKISYPLLQGNGQFATYEVTYNRGETIQSVTVAAADKWNANEASLVKVHKLLRTMSAALDNAGFGGEKVIYAGASAFDALLALIEATDKPKVPVKLRDDGSVGLGGYSIQEMAEAYRHPKTGATVKKLADGELRMISRGYTTLVYAALDDLDAKLQPLPMFVKPIEQKNPSGYQLVAESKPLPAVAPRATCKAVVIS